MFWKKKTLVIATVNARMMPIDRGDVFEDPLDEELKRLKFGRVTGGGTAMAETMEVDHCDLEIQLTQNNQESWDAITSFLEEAGAPKGSFLMVGEQKIPFGKTEGLAVYMNGTELAPEVYESCDINHVYQELNRLVEGEGMIYSHWEGPTETAMYLYGVSFESMKAKIQPLLDSYPLCEKCRVAQVA
ncbi:MAG TPA: hypothetical protein VK171_15145 [Fimbriimonas sp.]|nr:hypothetical protein [Fimbriimonas sp.]